MESPTCKRQQNRKKHGTKIQRGSVAADHWTSLETHTVPPHSFQACSNHLIDSDAVNNLMLDTLCSILGVPRTELSEANMMQMW